MARGAMGHGWGSLEINLALIDPESFSGKHIRSRLVSNGVATRLSPRE